MLYHELLVQARHLASKEPKRPKDASLRRAVSAAYYSLFHLLIEDATRLFLGAQRKSLRHRLARSFEHRRMRDAANEIAGSNSAPAELKRAASAFVHLQKQRHAADYDLAKRFSRSEVQSLLSKAEAAIQDWKSASAQSAAETFLLSLLVKLH